MAKDLTPTAQKIITVIAQIEAKKRMASQLLPEHVLLALLKTENTEAMRMLRVLNVGIGSFITDVTKSLETESTAGISIQGDLPLNIRIRETMSVAAYEARLMNAEFVTTGHLLLALSRETDTTASLFFKKLSLSLSDLRNAQQAVQPEFEVQKVSTKGASEVKKENAALDEFCRDLTAEAREGKIDPVIGRDSEITRVIQILSRRTKNNAVLLGDPGVGKTSVAEGLALRLAANDVPRTLADRRLLILDMAAVVAGTKFRGEFEERIKRIMKEIARAGNVIIFIDELHTLIGAGSGEGSMDASNMIKPALARGTLQCIGATTLTEYRKYIEKDAAFERRFQKVMIDEPSDEETVAILNGIKKRYEEHHGVLYSDEAIRSAVTLTSRYITDRFMPDKAIDVLDEAGAMKKIENDVRPPELDELEKEIAALSAEKQDLVKNQNYERAAQLRDRVRVLREQLEEIRKKWLSGENAISVLVTSNDIAHVISVMTGIPLDRLEVSDKNKLLNIETELNRIVIGQSEAVSVIAAAIRRSRTGLSSYDRPAGSFVFLGPTGVGKTLLAKTLATFLSGSEDSLIRIDMSDYMEKHNASRLVGAPPGYVGYDEGGVLTEKVRRNPYSVVLLDEIEKAHRDVLNLLLQILEEGELKDNLGHTVNFRNTIIIMTSNAGARNITAESRVGFSEEEGLLSYHDIKNNAVSELKKLFNPELLNRIDETVVFKPLEKEQLNEILTMQLAQLQTRLEQYAVTLNVKKRAKLLLVEKTRSNADGARPLRRIIQKELEDALSSDILTGRITHGCTVIVDAVQDTLKISVKQSETNVGSVDAFDTTKKAIQKEKKHKKGKSAVMKDIPSADVNQQPGIRV